MGPWLKVTASTHAATLSVHVDTQETNLFPSQPQKVESSKGSVLSNGVALKRGEVHQK